MIATRAYRAASRWNCRRLLALVLLCAGSAGVSAGEFVVRRDVAFLPPDRPERLDLYLPASHTPTKPGPAMVWIHGGGWTGGNKGAARERNVCRALAVGGYVCASIDYKLGAGAWPQNLLDAKNAVRYLRAHAAELGVDPERIGVAGGSAGGHLALLVGFTTGQPGLEPQEPYAGVSSAVACVVDLYGITNLSTRQETKRDGTPTGRHKAGGAAVVFGPSARESEVFRIASPVTHVTAKSPPVLILHGRADTTVDREQSVELARVLEKHGVPQELVLLDGVGHTFDLETWNRKPLPRDLRPVVLGFLAKHLGAR